MVARQNSRRTILSKKGKLVMLAKTIALVVMISQVVTIITALYLPNEPKINLMQRRQDSADDEDDMDQGASAPYQNQGKNAEGPSNADAYEDNEPDGPYDETPRDEEGQADMERFFEDNLGASERDGMDKENLPSNLISSFVIARPIAIATTSHQLAKRSIVTKPVYGDNASQITTAANEDANMFGANNQSIIKYVKHTEILPNLQTRYIKIPNQPLIVERQITSDLTTEKDADLAEVPSNRQVQHQQHNNNHEPEIQTQAEGQESNDVVATEDEDMDPVYVTKLTNQPFKIDALGGFDPEEDFQDASRDIEETGGRFDEPLKEKEENNRNKKKKREKKKKKKKNDEEQDQPTPTKDISFNDPEADTLFNDGSETDEITFSQDYPYPVDLEAEIKKESSEQSNKQIPITRNIKPPREGGRAAVAKYIIVPVKMANNNGGGMGDSSKSSRRERKKKEIESRSDDDDSEGGWVNDGIDDMEIPSQSHQDAVLEKAAIQEALANKRRAQAEEDAEAQQQQQANADDNQEDGENQRMPSADYMKADMTDYDQNELAS